MSKKTDDAFIAALLREREGYVQFGKKDRVAAVDAELKRRGYEEPKKAEPKGRAAPESKQITAAAPAKTTAAKAEPTRLGTSVKKVEPEKKSEPEKKV